MRDPDIVLEAVSRYFPSGATRVHALRDVTLTVDAGEAVAVTGPSGSGKTTLLNVIAGLDRPSEGSVTVLGHALNDMRQSRLTALRAEAIGLAFQDPHLLPGLTALENVVVARLPWAPRRRLEAEARQLLDAVGLGARKDHSPARLSGGERQRVAIARALLGGRRLLLADEPTGNLDAQTTEEVLRLLDTLRADLGLTVLVATHDAAVAAIASRTVRLVDGSVESDRVVEAALVDVHVVE